jgi:hypothetical protein
LATAALAKRERALDSARQKPEKTAALAQKARSRSADGEGEAKTALESKASKPIISARVESRENGAQKEPSMTHDTFDNAIAAAQSAGVRQARWSFATEAEAREALSAGGEFGSITQTMILSPMDQKEKRLEAMWAATAEGGPLPAWAVEGEQNDFVLDEASGKTHVVAKALPRWASLIIDREREAVFAVLFERDAKAAGPSGLLDSTARPRGVRVAKMGEPFDTSRAAAHEEVLSVAYDELLASGDNLAHARAAWEAEQIASDLGVGASDEMAKNRPAPRM